MVGTANSKDEQIKKLETELNDTKSLLTISKD